MPFKSRAQQRWMFATHPEMAQRWAAETPSFSSLPARVKHAQGGLASLGDDDVVHAGVGGLINKLARLVQRPLTAPSFATEAASDASGPLTAAQARARFGLARSDAKAMGHDYADLPVEEGQGVWVSPDGGIQENALYMQRLPRHAGRIDNYQDALNYAADMGRLLDQRAVPVARAIPGLIDTADGSNAVIASKVPRGALATLGKTLGADAVVAQQPGDRALMFPLGDADIESIRRQAQAAVPGLSLRYGVSDPGVDRVLLGDDPSYMTDYADYGVNPRTPAYSELERKLLKTPLIAQDLSGPFPPGGAGLAY